MGLPDGCGDEAYLQALQQAIETLSQRFSPQLIIYPPVRIRMRATGSAGSNSPWAAGSARCPVFDYALARRLPVAVAMAGGYGRQIEDTVAVHVQTVALAAQYQLRHPLRGAAATARVAGAAA